MQYIHCKNIKKLDYSQINVIFIYDYVRLINIVYKFISSNIS